MLSVIRLFKLPKALGNEPCNELLSNTKEVSEANLPTEEGKLPDSSLPLRLKPVTWDDEHTTFGQLQTVVRGTPPEHCQPGDNDDSEKAFVAIEISHIALSLSPGVGDRVND